MDGGGTGSLTSTAWQREEAVKRSSLTPSSAHNLSVERVKDPLSPLQPQVTTQGLPGASSDWRLAILFFFLGLLASPESWGYKLERCWSGTGDVLERCSKGRAVGLPPPHAKTGMGAFRSL